mmetsp:Transcript_52871/g.116041  ORF Transcript_52871/g.116041 Transcript_52871/m.116041 type:complete len:182 (-) Transcript_52871:155-700(-)
MPSNVFERAVRRAAEQPSGWGSNQHDIIAGSTYKDSFLNPGYGAGPCPKPEAAPRVMRETHPAAHRRGRSDGGVLSARVAPGLQDTLSMRAAGTTFRDGPRWISQGKAPTKFFEPFSGWMSDEHRRQFAVTGERNRRHADSRNAFTDTLGAGMYNFGRSAHPMPGRGVNQLFDPWSSAAVY